MCSFLFGHLMEYEKIYVRQCKINSVRRGRGGGRLTSLGAQTNEMEATYHVYMQTYRFFPAQFRSMPVYTVSTVLLTLPYKLRLAIHSCVLTTQYSQLDIARSLQWIMCAYNAVCIVEYDLVIVYDLCTKNIQEIGIYTM